jgi:GT2 family glycosyltransferase
MTFDSTIFDEPHHQSLERLAARYLAQGDGFAAYQLSDRRCRILPAARPHCFVLRSDAAFLMGEKADAILDVIEALKTAPEDIAANRRLLAWGDTDQRTDAAKALLPVERDFDVLRAAMAILQTAGRHRTASVRVMDDVIEGWVAWEGANPVAVEITDDSDAVITLIEPDPNHPLSGIRPAAAFNIARPKSRRPHTILLSVDGEVFYLTRAAANESNNDTILSHLDPGTGKSDEITVVVPVFADYEATEACLTSLLNNFAAAPSSRVIVVNDASPEPRMAAFLTRISSLPEIQILTNPRNLGFIGAVNRALELIPRGDVVLLNSDTIIPSGAVERLATAARSHPRIGTVTPFSNNSQFTSFPIPNEPNPIPSPDEIDRIDRLALSANSGAVVDLPNGLGMCLYITRACLDAVGLLSEEFYPGYYEDVYFCLRARQRGFRNVCATSVYIGHVGSRSFAQSKKTLVHRNLPVIERLFPRYRFECAAFTRADPLRPFREAIERLDSPWNQRPDLLVTASGVMSEVARQRARQLAARARPALILELQHWTDGPAIRLFDPTGGIPQSIACKLSHEIDWLRNYLTKMKPSRIELVGSATIPGTLCDLLRGLGIPYDLLLADVAVPEKHEQSNLLFSTGFAKRGAQRTINGERANAQTLEQWHRIADGATRILLPVDGPQELVQSALTEKQAERLSLVGEAQVGHTVKPKQRIGRLHLGIIPIRSCVREQSMIRGITRSLQRMRPDLKIVVLGATLNDIELMRSNVFVTGAIPVPEFERILRSYGPDSLLVAIAQPLFGHPLLSETFRYDIPTAYFDWSFGTAKPRQHDLPISPDLPLDKLVAALSRWLRRL